MPKASLDEFFQFLSCQLQIQSREHLDKVIPVHDKAAEALFPQVDAHVKPNLGNTERWVPYHTVLGVHELFLMEAVHSRKDWNEKQKFLAMFIFRAHCKRDLFMQAQLPLMKKDFWKNPAKAFEQEGPMEKAMRAYRKRTGKPMLTNCFRIIPERTLSDDDANLVRSIITRSARLIGLAEKSFDVVKDKTLGVNNSATELAEKGFLWAQRRLSFRNLEDFLFPFRIPSTGDWYTMACHGAPSKVVSAPVPEEICRVEENLPSPVEKMGLGPNLSAPADLWNAPWDALDSEISSVFSDLRSQSDDKVDEELAKAGPFRRAFPERTVALLVTLTVEIPVALIITGGSKELKELVGLQRYTLLMAFLPLTSAISGNVGLQASSLTTRAISHGKLVDAMYPKVPEGLSTDGDLVPGGDIRVSGNLWLREAFTEAGLLKGAKAEDEEKIEDEQQRESDGENNMEVDEDKKSQKDVDDSEDEKSEKEAEKSEDEKKEEDADDSEDEKSQKEEEKSEDEKKKEDAEDNEDEKSEEAEKSEDEKKEEDADESEDEKSEKEAAKSEDEKKEEDPDESEDEKSEKEAAKSEDEKNEEDADEREDEKSEKEAEKSEDEKKEEDADESEDEKSQKEAEKSEDEKKKEDADDSEDEKSQKEAEENEDENKEEDAEDRQEEEKTVKTEYVKEEHQETGSQKSERHDDSDDSSFESPSSSSLSSTSWTTSSSSWSSSAKTEAKENVVEEKAVEAGRLAELDGAGLAKYWDYCLGFCQDKTAQEALIPERGNDKNTPVKSANKRTDDFLTSMLQKKTKRKRLQQEKDLERCLEEEIEKTTPAASTSGDGWTVEIRKRTSGKAAGQTYKVWSDKAAVEPTEAYLKCEKARKDLMRELEEDAANKVGRDLILKEIERKRAAAAAVASPQKAGQQVLTESNEEKKRKRAEEKMKEEERKKKAKAEKEDLEKKDAAKTSTGSDGKSGSKEEKETQKAEEKKKKEESKKKAKGPKENDEKQDAAKTSTGSDGKSGSKEEKETQKAEEKKKKEESKKKAKDPKENDEKQDAAKTSTGSDGKSGSKEEKETQKAEEKKKKEESKKKAKDPKENDEKQDAAKTSTGSDGKSGSKEEKETQKAEEKKKEEESKKKAKAQKENDEKKDATKTSTGSDGKSGSKEEKRKLDQADVDEKALKRHKKEAPEASTLGQTKRKLPGDVAAVGENVREEFRRKELRPGTDSGQLCLGECEMVVPKISLPNN
eukprot:symbB.v1.2.009719.t2/scaffold624.1/size179468/7